MQRGYVRWFNDARGYGLIDCDETLTKVYVHFSDIDEDVRSLDSGAEVFFEVRQGPNGLYASHVHYEPQDLGADKLD